MNKGALIPMKPGETQREYNTRWRHERNKDPEYRKKMAKTFREYRKRNPEIIKEREKRIKRLNPEKQKAVNKLNFEVASGRVKRKPCVICGEKKTHAHHEDYSKPLEVIWLCPYHHKALHHGYILLSVIKAREEK